MNIEIKKITKDERDFYEVKTPIEVVSQNWDSIEVYWEPKIMEMYDLEWRKRLLEKMIEDHSNELAEVNNIISKIKKLWAMK